MNNQNTITKEQFLKRLTTLSLRSGLSGMPKDENDQHILLKSATLLIDSKRTHSEKEINEKLEQWLNDVCEIKFFDRVTLRRWLVDSGYLTRENNGTDYQVALSGPVRELYEESIDGIDIIQAIRDAREEMERRKQFYMNKKQGV